MEIPAESTSSQIHNHGLWDIPLHPHWDTSTLKYFYKAPAYQSTGNKQEQLEMCVQSQSFDLIAETDTVG